MEFLSSESRALMGIKDVGEWKHHAIVTFKGILSFDGSQQPKNQLADPAPGGSKG